MAPSRIGISISSTSPAISRSTTLSSTSDASVFDELNLLLMQPTTKGANGVAYARAIPERQQVKQMLQTIASS